MSDDDLWRPKDHPDSSEEKAEAGEAPEPVQGVSDETQPLTGASSAPPPTPPTPPGPTYEPPSGPSAVPPPYNPYGQPAPPPSQPGQPGQPGQAFGQPYGQQQPNPYGGQPYAPPPNPYQPPNEYVAPQNPYGSPYQPAYAGGGRPDHPSATTSMVLGIIGLVGILFCGGITLLLSPFAWFMGAKAVREIDAEPGRYGGRDRAQGGKIMGIIGTVLLALGVAAIIAFIVLAVAVGSSDSSPVYPDPTFQNG